MMKAALLLGSLLAATPTMAKAPPAWPSGTYGNVQTHEETGDMLGMEARFFVANGRHMVEFVFCEGWCNTRHRAEVAREGQGFAFVLAEKRDDGGVDRLRFVLTQAGRGFVYQGYQGDDRTAIYEAPQRLRRIARPFGLDVAKPGKD